VRKVLAFAQEAGLGERIELVRTDVWALDTDIHRDNPLGKIPALITGDGTFIGSLLCCEYLDSLHGGRPLIPTAPSARWPVLQLHALGDGIMEAAVARVVEAVRRPKEFVYQGNLDRQEAKLRHALDAIEGPAAALGGRVDIATITLACALAYLDFRLPQIDWRRGRPMATRWHADFAARPSMMATEPRL
ncbi:MAG TPA: glutathione S-transferase family protein, partial [Stellaceae bacterium]|nr:glutathione S-transferase family protein [Stellaceae bacterium]